MSLEADAVNDISNTVLGQPVQLIERKREAAYWEKGFRWSPVSCFIRVPSPPARITHCMSFPSLNEEGARSIPLAGLDSSRTLTPPCERSHKTSHMHGIMQSIALPASGVGVSSE